MRRIITLVAVFMVAVGFGLLNVGVASSNPYDDQLDGEGYGWWKPDLDSYGSQRLYTYCNPYNNIPQPAWDYIVGQINMMDQDDSTWTAVPETCKTTTDGQFVTETQAPGVGGYATCLKALPNDVCDAFKISADQNAIFAGSVQEAGGVYNPYIFAWNLGHVYGHEAGHGMGQRHIDDPPDPGCGPDAAEPAGGASGLMGWNYPCNESLYGAHRNHFTLHDAQHMQCWYTQQDLPGGVGCN